MKRALASCITDCLRQPAPSEHCLAQIRRFSRGDWEDTMFWLSSSGLPHYFLIRLRELCSETLLQPKILDKLNRNLAANRGRVQVMAQEFDNLNHRLSDAAIKFAAVRGFDLAPEYCAELAMRTWYCHEYLLSPGSLPRAREVVERAGFPFRRTGARGELCFAIPSMQPPARMDEVYTANFPRMVVLHHKLWDNQSNVEVFPVKNVLEDCRMSSWAGLSFPTLTDDALLEFVVLDTFARVLGYWCKPSWFLEVANFLQSRLADEDFWRCFYRRIEGRGKLSEIAGVVFLLASRLFAVDIPSAVRPHLAQLPTALGIWVESYGKDWAMARFPGSKLSLFLEGELVRDSTAWEHVRRRRLFPLPRTQGMAQVASAGASRAEENPRSWKRLFRRMKFHGITTYQYARELPRWNHLRELQP